MWSELTISGFDDPDLGWCWVSVHRDVSAERDEQELGRLRQERLGEALRGLPLLAYTADRELRCTLLFDNLVDPARSDAPRSGPDDELFGPLLADQITTLNRRVLVTATSAAANVDAGERAVVRVSIEPVFTSSGELIGLVGSALAQQPITAAQVKVELEGRAHRARGSGVFSRLR
jgi:hypothetical protein